MRSNLRAWLILLAIAVLFYWKLILVRQYSLLLDYEGTNQMFAWFQFLRTSFLHGQLPLWDQFAFSGHPFTGEMQTGAFYPFYLLFLVLPTKDGAISVSTYHAFYVTSHALAACFMYTLCREMKLSFRGSLVAAVSFSFGGIIAGLGQWPHLLESALWLPFIMLATLRSIRAETRRLRIAWACFSGLAIAMSILAGGLHFVIMNGIGLVSALAFDAFTSPAPAVAGKRNAFVAVVCLAIALGGGAAQLIPSAEYSHRAYRFYGSGAGVASERIPYNSISDNLSAQGLGTLVFPVPAEQVSDGEFLNPYMGVFPIVLAIAGIAVMWSEKWVRYFAGLAAASFLFALGSFSWLHGVLYALVPWLWMAREPNRFMFLANFALAILAGVGLDALSRHACAIPLIKLEQILKWVAVAAGVLLLSPAIVKIQISSWTGLSLLLIVLSWAMLKWLSRRGVTRWNAALVVAFILFDVNAFNWGPADINSARVSGQDQMALLKSCAKAMEFLKGQPAPFRIEVQASPAPNIGDFYGVESTWGAGVTVLTDYLPMKARQDLLNAKYVLKPASATDPDPVYADKDWKVYKRKDAYPRAWIVHHAHRFADKAELQSALGKQGADLHGTAFLISDAAVSAGQPLSGGTDEIQSVDVGRNRVAARVNAGEAGLLIFSEVYYPGWAAKVNGVPARILQVDGDLRAVEIPVGNSSVEMSYSPPLILAGLVLSCVVFLGAGAWAIYAVVGRRARISIPVSRAYAEAVR